jgi:hypothetical protein
MKTVTPRWVWPPAPWDHNPASPRYETEQEYRARIEAYIVDVKQCGEQTDADRHPVVTAARRSVLTLVVVLLAMSGTASAQTVTADRFQLKTGPCVERSGSGTPEGAVTGNVCDLWRRTDTGTVYYKISGSGNTGWISWTSGNTANAPVARDGSGGFSMGALLATAVTDSALTSGRVPVISTGGLLSDDADLTFSGGDTLTATKMAAGSLVTPLIFTNGVANLTLQPAGDLYLDPVGNDVVPAINYDINLGAINLKYLTLHAAELWVETLVAQNTIATIGGRVLVAPTTMLTVDLAPGGTTITVKHNQMASGDRVYMEADGKIEFMAITSGAGGGVGAYTYSVTRDLDGTGANQWYAGDAMLNTGTTGKGFIDLYSLSGVLSGSGPTIVGNVRTGTTFNNIAPRWAIGNLNGLFGYGTEVYGAVFGDPSATNVTVDATNGFRIRSGTTNKFFADTSGNLSLVGSLDIGTAGSLSSGATAYGTGTGYWLDYNGGTPRFRVGTTAGNRLSWDGTDLTLASANLTIDANGVYIVPTTTYQAARSFGWTVSGGVMGLAGATGTGGAPVRTLGIQNYLTSGSAPITQVYLYASSDSAGVIGSSMVLWGLDASNTVADLTADIVRVSGSGGTGVFQIGPNPYADSTTVFSVNMVTGVTTIAPVTGTNPAYAAFTNTGGTSFVGNDDSTAATFALGGNYAFTLYGGTAGGTNIAAANGAGVIRFFSGGASERMRLSAAGGFGIGTTTDPGAGGLIVNGNTTFTGTTTYNNTANYPGAAGGGNRLACFNNAGDLFVGSATTCP